MTIREMIKQLEEIEMEHGNIEVDQYCKCGECTLVQDVTYDEGYAGINFKKNRG